VIPTLILFGLVFGHWWRTTLAVAFVGWPVLLLASGVDIELGSLPAAAGLGAANAAVGILIHQVVWRLVRAVTSAARRVRDIAHSRP
jgi:hypothetical protein